MFHPGLTHRAKPSSAVPFGIRSGALRRRSMGSSLPDWYKAPSAHDVRERVPLLPRCSGQPVVVSLALPHVILLFGVFLTGKFPLVSPFEAIIVLRTRGSQFRAVRTSDVTKLPMATTRAPSRSFHDIP
ncbi:hypothetical protein JZ751_024005 [Albula glossodonta]|uniref:Uncharacterized protein n=1 Tax=Albula glossodonta TaxID=121402 RepID=A0A8T2MR25_9TELE|nr:hypothetical protein JZ751_024005 [Albula glossodonta]